MAGESGAVARAMAAPPLTFDPRAGTVASFAEGRMRVLCLRTGACLFDRATQPPQSPHHASWPVLAARYAEHADGFTDWWNARWWVGGQSGALGFVEGPQLARECWP